MSHQKQIITLSLSPEIINRLNHFATEQNMSIEDIAGDLLSQALNIKKHDITRIVSCDRKTASVPTDHEILREIIHRQDEEISWLRGQIARLSTLSPTTHVIRHEYPALIQDPRAAMQRPVLQETKSSVAEEKESEGSAIPPAPISVDDVQYSLSESGIESEELIPSGFAGPERAGDRMLRDSIGGVIDEILYTVSEAAAIAGESESVLLEYIADGFLPALRDGPVCRIRGIDLRRYMMSK